MAARLVQPPPLIHTSASRALVIWVSRSTDGDPTALLSAQTYRPPASRISAATYDRPPAIVNRPRLLRPVITSGHVAAGGVTAFHLAIERLGAPLLVEEERQVLEPLRACQRCRFLPLGIGDDRHPG